MAGACTFLLSLLLSILATETMADTSTIKLRVILVRHGESEANERGFIAGQSDWPLNKNGQQQARALGRTGWLRRPAGHHFWRLYSSDLVRASATAQLALESAEQAQQEEIRLDARLREKAFGAREGYTRAMDYEECVRLRQERGDPIPLLETNEDIWIRAHAWLCDVIKDLMTEIDDSNDDVYELIAFAHAGFIRQLVLHVIGEERVREHPAAKFDTANEKRLLVPNTSVSVVELTLPRDEAVKLSQTTPYEGAELLELNWAEHLEGAVAENTVD